VPVTLVIYESPQRAVASLADMEAAFGDREAFLCREATKLHEEYRRGPLSELRAALEDRDAVKGELVFVVAGAGSDVAVPTERLEDAFTRLVASGKTRREAVKDLARLFRLPAREVYARVSTLPSRQDA
jgi:16S rRNA (cytidine1402-2'-O)-methyltransferase